MESPYSSMLGMCSYLFLECFFFLIHWVNSHSSSKFSSSNTFYFNPTHMPLHILSASYTHAPTHAHTLCILHACHYTCTYSASYTYAPTDAHTLCILTGRDPICSSYQQLLALISAKHIVGCTYTHTFTASKSKQMVIIKV